MNKYAVTTCLVVLVTAVACHFEATAQVAPRVQAIFPKEITVYGNIPYAKDTLQRHLLDIYLPAGAKTNSPLIIWVHGGAWMLNDKYADMSYMKNTIRSLLDSGYALASIDYRYSTTAPFPTQVQDCNQAVGWLYDHAQQYGFDPNRFALIGFSAGGHLASLLALSNNNSVRDFYFDGRPAKFRIRCVLDFYGPSDLIAIANRSDSTKQENNPVALLLGAHPVDRPDLARRASPVNYIDKGDPAFLIVQGEKDESVPYTQSKLLHSWLRLNEVKTELIIVPGAPHYGEMFDAGWIRERLFKFLSSNMK